MQKIDRLLGPLNPNTVAASTAPDPIKIIVFTATGDQGRSVCEKLVEDGGFEVMGVTRNVDGKAAKALSARGVNMVRGDLDDPESYKQFLQGMDGAFVNADFFSTYFANGQDSVNAQEVEVRQIKAVIDACKAAGVGHVVFSALDGYEEEERKVPHFESKAQTVKYLKETYEGHAEHPDRPHGLHHHLHWTNIYTCTYFSDLIKFHQLNPDPSSTTGEEWILGLPIPDDTKVAGFAVEQLGLWVKKAFLDHKHWRGKDMQVCAEYMTPLEMAEILSEQTGKKVRPLGLSHDAFHSEKHKKNLGDALWKNYNASVAGYFERDIEASRKVCPEQWDFKGWALQSKELAALFNSH
ncbi:hypothetical protein IAR55_005153 [Kwoniella newhampshirensis]|uniref:NmrA-like domain-containing protein n=1 Tax=Kwoniella newhampshirensis TaxID=1651941 RepID=A0AAW0YX99_9TREE